ncbi:MAG: hypothetical protein Q8891_07525 [Bacteroidota bacterium]|jgi:hypothetical protein|nr:hypothetical protein [Bacteroidota bacterium]
MKKYFFFLFFSCVNTIALTLPHAIAFPRSTASNPVKKIVREIAKSNIYKFTPSADNSDTRSVWDRRYEELRKSASVEELTQLATKHKNAVVRLYAFRALVTRLKNIPGAIIDQIRNDSTVVSTLQNNKAGQSPVNKIALSFLY